MSKQGNPDNQAQNENAGMFPLFYNDPQPLDAQRHANFGLIENFGLDFCREANAVPVNLIEMPQISHHYPIAFSPDEGATPVAILGLRDNENLFFAKDGGWEVEGYVPAYIRRYPFIFSEIRDSDQLSLCVDMREGVVAENASQLFFEKDGGPTQLSKNAMEFCKSYHAAAQQTLAFSKDLVEYDLLIERQVEIAVEGHQKINFSGFRIIDEEKFAKLGDDVFLELRKKGWIPYIYAHLFSGAQWQNLTRLLSNRLVKDAA